MAVVAPFMGITYNTRKIREIAKVIAPPYDVISEATQEALYRAHPYNVVRLILGRKKQGDSDWDNRYTRAAELFRRWQSEAVLERASQPCMYVTSLRYDGGEGRGTKTRWGFVALVRIEDEGSGLILPHERTFSAHKDDRLKLMRTCSAQFSQVFGLYEDPQNEIFKAVGPWIDGPPELSFELEDATRHALWTLTDRGPFEEIGRLLRAGKIFIADGHHRYETARNFRDLLRARYGRRASNRAYEFVMVYLTNLCDAGLTILPSHRLIRALPGFEPGPFLQHLAPWFDISPHPVTPAATDLCWENIEQTLRERGQTTTAFVFYCHGHSEAYLLALKPAARGLLGDDLHPALKQLDVLVLSRFVFQKALGFRREDLDNEEIFAFESDPRKTISMVASGLHRMCFLMNPTRVSQVKEVAEHRLVMPRKSTYFYPKVPTGLVFNKIDPHEVIQVP
jgi:uncharacterized protein (DUF1015 family)